MEILGGPGGGGGLITEVAGGEEVEETIAPEGTLVLKTIRVVCIATKFFGTRRQRYTRLGNDATEESDSESGGGDPRGAHSHNWTIDDSRSNQEEKKKKKSKSLLARLALT